MWTTPRQREEEEEERSSSITSNRISMMTPTPTQATLVPIMGYHVKVSDDDNTIPTTISTATNTAAVPPTIGDVDDGVAIAGLRRSGGFTEEDHDNSNNEQHVLDVVVVGDGCDDNVLGTSSRRSSSKGTTVAATRSTSSTSAVMMKRTEDDLDAILRAAEEATMDTATSVDEVRTRIKAMVLSSLSATAAAAAVDAITTIEDDGGGDDEGKHDTLFSQVDDHQAHPRSSTETSSYTRWRQQQQQQQQRQRRQSTSPDNNDGPILEHDEEDKRQPGLAQQMMSTYRSSSVLSFKTSATATTTSSSSSSSSSSSDSSSSSQYKPLENCHQQSIAIRGRSSSNGSSSNSSGCSTGGSNNDSLITVKDDHDEEGMVEELDDDDDDDDDDIKDAASEIGRMMFEALTMQEWQREEQYEIATELAATATATQQLHSSDDSQEEEEEDEVVDEDDDTEEEEAGGYYYNYRSTTSQYAPGAVPGAGMAKTTMMTTKTTAEIDARVTTPSNARTTTQQARGRGKGEHRNRGIMVSTTCCGNSRSGKGTTTTTTSTNEKKKTQQKHQQQQAPKKKQQRMITLSLHEQLQRQERLRHAGVSIPIDDLEVQMKNKIHGKVKDLVENCRSRSGTSGSSGSDDDSNYYMDEDAQDIMDDPRLTGNTKLQHPAHVGGVDHCSSVGSFERRVVSHEQAKPKEEEQKMRGDGQQNIMAGVAETAWRIMMSFSQSHTDDTTIVAGNLGEDDDDNILQHPDPDLERITDPRNDDEAGGPQRDDITGIWRSNNTETVMANAANQRIETATTFPSRPTIYARVGNRRRRRRQRDGGCGISCMLASICLLLMMIMCGIGVFVLFMSRGSSSSSSSSSASDDGNGGGSDILNDVDGSDNNSTHHYGDIYEDSHSPTGAVSASSSPAPATTTASIPVTADVPTQSPSLKETLEFVSGYVLSPQSQPPSSAPVDTLHHFPTRHPNVEESDEEEEEDSGDDGSMIITSSTIQMRTTEDNNKQSHHHSPRQHNQNDDGYLCFTSRKELYDAVEDYIHNYSDGRSTTIVTMKYGSPIGTWRVGGSGSSNNDGTIITDMSDLFSGYTSFNDDISNWNMKYVTDISGMFYGATSFKQNLCNWGRQHQLSKDINVTNMFVGTNCISQEDPDMYATPPGPFCYPCGN